MPKLKKSYSDHGTSQNRDGLWFADHDSNMDFAEVSRLVLAGKGLLSGVTFDDTDLLQRPFKLLLDALESLDTEIDVTKGIHQRLEDPHITFTIAGDEFNDVYEFHLQLSAELVDRAYADGTKTRRFVWKAVKLSVFVATKANSSSRSYCSYPVGTVARTTGRARGYSITEGQIEAHVNAVNKEQADKAQAAREEEERKKLEMAALLEKTEDKFPSLGGSTFKSAPKKIQTPVPVTKPGTQPAKKPGGWPF